MADLEHAPAPARSDSRRSGDLRLAMANAIVGLYRRHYGRGPTRSKTYLFDDVVLCVLHGGTLPIERTLTAAGREDVVNDMRRAFHEATRGDFVEVVERLTGRRVASFLSQFEADRDVSIEFFQLEAQR